MLLQLERNEEPKTEIAHFHRSNLGIVGTKHKADLEILPGGIHIVDDIVVTFVYLDKLRRARQPV
jgi:hypothetical protein